MKKNTLLFIFFLLALIVLSTGNTASALEFPLPGLKDSPSVPEYVDYLFKTIIGLAALIASISFAIGAVQYIISLDNPTAGSNAKDRMKGAILGLILTFSSFIILKTINPSLTKLTLKPLPSVLPLPTVLIPGVYYYTESGCSGNFSSGHNTSETQIDGAFAGKIRSVKVVRGSESDPFYIIIFHQFGLDELGGCNRPIVALSENCYSIENPNNTGSVDITPVRSSPGSPGDGVTFYSEAHGFSMAQLKREGKLYVSDWTIVPIWSLPANAIEYNYDDAVNVSEDYKRVNKTFQDRPGTIQMTGNYLVALYSRDSENANSIVCQTFKATVPDLNAVRITTTGGSDLENVYIMPNK